MASGHQLTIIVVGCIERKLVRFHKNLGSYFFIHYIVYCVKLKLS